MKKRVIAMLILGATMIGLAGCSPKIDNTEINEDVGPGNEIADASPLPVNPNADPIVDSTIKSEVPNNDTSAEGSISGEASSSAEGSGAIVYSSDNMKLYVNNITRGTNSNIMGVKQDFNNGFILFYTEFNDKSCDISVTKLLVNDIEMPISSTATVTKENKWAQFYWYTDKDSKNEKQVNSIKVSLIFNFYNGDIESVDKLEVLVPLGNMQYVQVIPVEEVPVDKDKDKTTSTMIGEDGKPVDAGTERPVTVAPSLAPQIPVRKPVYDVPLEKQPGVKEVDPKPVVVPNTSTVPEAVTVPEEAVNRKRVK